MIIPFLLALSPALAAPSPTPAVPIGSVVKVTGTAWLISAKGKTAAKAGEPVGPKMRLKTGAKSTLTAKLGGDVVVMLKENSEAAAEELTEKDTEVTLSQGAVLSHVRNPDKRVDHFRLRTRSSVMGVRGTTFFVKIEPGKGDHLCACHGTIGLSKAGGGKPGPISELTGKNHDTFGMIANGKLTTAPMDTDHTDADIAELEKAFR